MNEDQNPKDEMTVMRPPNWPERNRELREEEWEAHKECLEAARRGLRLVRGRKFTVNEVARLLELASKLGRLATGMATDHVEHDHAWSQYHNPAFLAEIDREIEKVFGKPIEVKAERWPVSH